MMTWDQRKYWMQQTSDTVGREIACSIYKHGLSINATQMFRYLHIHTKLKAKHDQMLKAVYNRILEVPKANNFHNSEVKHHS